MLGFPGIAFRQIRTWKSAGLAYQSNSYSRADTITPPSRDTRPKALTPRDSKRRYPSKPYTHSPLPIGRVTSYLSLISSEIE
ncbi:unnamed protein product [Sphenostylis stenocarpa]|uniref:Uncharacterized protein n=1 Tax=Sphenostylis stenocarpa TaxID=92480 RepID=A0AA86W448_9FABA|nr:unnamed protein product [Sphenostylis stenocarpa]